MKSIKIAHGRIHAAPPHEGYKVVTVKNSTAYNPGQILDKEIVNDLCARTTWDVTIVPLDVSKN